MFDDPRRRADVAVARMALHLQMPAIERMLIRAGVVDALGHHHAPRGLGVLSGRFVSDASSMSAVLKELRGHEDARPALSKLRLVELRDLSGHAGLVKSGRKADLVERLAQHVKAPAPAKATRPAAKKRAAAAKGMRPPPAKPVDIHGLFVADDATIEAAMRDVYEGKFGPYTTRVTVHIKRGPTEPSIGVDGKIYDASGNEIGYFSRSIGPTELNYRDGTIRREVWTYHGVVQLGAGDEDPNPTRYHGKGFGGEFNRRAIAWYRASGVHGIGQNDTNFYVWASQGFNFSGGVMPDYKQDELRELVANLRAGRAKNRYGETIPAQLRNAPDLDAQIAEAEALLARLATTRPGEPDYPTAYEVSQLGRNGRRGKTKTWIGKFLGVSADEMILNPDEGEVVGARPA